MGPERLRDLLEQLRRGDVSVDDAVAQLKQLPFSDVAGIATLDNHRALRQGTPEVVYGESKTAEQVVTITKALHAQGQNILVTRLDADKAAAVCAALPEVSYHALARIAQHVAQPPPQRPCKPVAIVTAGTSDMAVAEEAAITLAALGLEPSRMFDVGVAGLHRLLGQLERFEQVSAAIVVAGMEGALPSVVGGLVACPVVAVPTSVGYGTALGGLTALFGMLTSCASGVTVVNIDNGFGAAMAIHRILPGSAE